MNADIFFFFPQERLEVFQTYLARTSIQMDSGNSKHSSELCPGVSPAEANRVARGLQIMCHKEQLKDQCAQIKGKNILA